MGDLVEAKVLNDRKESLDDEVLIFVAYSIKAHIPAAHENMCAVVLEELFEVVDACLAVEPRLGN